MAEKAITYPVQSLLWGWNSRIRQNTISILKCSKPAKWYLGIKHLQTQFPWLIGRFIIVFSCTQRYENRKNRRQESWCLTYETSIKIGYFKGFWPRYDLTNNLSFNLRIEFKLILEYQPPTWCRDYLCCRL